MAPEDGVVYHELCGADDECDAALVIMPTGFKVILQKDGEATLLGTTETEGEAYALLEKHSARLSAEITD